MIKGAVVGDDRVKQFIGTRFPVVEKALYRTMSRIVIKFARKVKEEKLSGQVLKNRTGRLRRSIAPNVYGSGTTIIGEVGTNVEYAAAHEYGFHGTVTVKEHLRMMTKAFGRLVRNPHKIKVSRHQAQRNLPERSFLRSVLEEMRPEIRQDLENALVEAVRG